MAVGSLAGLESLGSAGLDQRDRVCSWAVAPDEFVSRDRMSSVHGIEDSIIEDSIIRDSIAASMRRATMHREAADMIVHQSVLSSCRRRSNRIRGCMTDRRKIQRSEQHQLQHFVSEDAAR